MFNKILKLDTIIIVLLIISELDTTAKEDRGVGEGEGEGGELEMYISTTKE